MVYDTISGQTRKNTQRFIEKKSKYVNDFYATMIFIIKFRNTRKQFLEVYIDSFNVICFRLQILQTDQTTLSYLEFRSKFVNEKYLN